MASNTENVSIWWRHHDFTKVQYVSGDIGFICRLYGRLRGLPRDYWLNDTQRLTLGVIFISTYHVRNLSLLHTYGWYYGMTNQSMYYAVFCFQKYCCWSYCNILFLLTIITIMSCSKHITRLSNVYTVPITMTSQWARWRLKSPASPLFTRLFGRRSKKTSKLRVTSSIWGIHRGPADSPHKWPVTRKMRQFDDVTKPIIRKWSLEVTEMN